MKRIVIVMMLCSIAVMGQDVADTVLTKKNIPFAVGISVGRAYMNGLWPSEGAYEDLLFSEYGELQPGFEWNGHSFGTNVSYDIGCSLSAEIGLYVRFKEKNVIMSNLRYGVVSEARNGVIDVPIILEYHKRWFYVSGGVLLEYGKFLEAPPYNSTIVKWWHWGATASVGGCFRLSEHSAIKAGLDVTAAFTPYSYEYTDWISGTPSKRHYQMHANQSYGVKICYVYHF